VMQKPRFRLFFLSADEVVAPNLNLKSTVSRLGGKRRGLK